MKRVLSTSWLGRLGLTCFAAVLAVNLATSARAAQATTLVKDGKPALTVLVDGAILPLDKPEAAPQLGERDEESFDGATEQRRAVRELIQYVQQMSGAALKVEAAKSGATGCYVGLATSFPWLKRDLKDLGEEGFVISSDGKSLCLLANRPLGVRQAVLTFLMDQGCRWFFPGKAWEVVPQQATIQGTYDIKQSPSFNMGRTIWYGYGTYPETGKDHNAWMYHNRMGGPSPVSIGHTNYGIDFDKDFVAHPEWFALVGGVRKHNKVCYSNPEVIARMTQYGLDQAAKGAKSISMSPADGLGFCECDKCNAWAKGGEVKADKGSFFATRPDGLLVCTVSEPLFNAVNIVAKAVGQKYPDVVLGCYGYSAYSHPPSFNLEPNVFIQTTTSYRRTPLTLEEQIDLWGQRAKQVGIRGYWSVFQWDWDGPMVGKFVPEQIQKDLQLYRSHNAVAFNTEASNNWAPRGLSYYLGSQLLWDVNADTKPIIKDFYEKAFGPAAKPMERYYVRFYGPSVAVIDPANASAADSAAYGKDLDATDQTLAATFKDLDEAAKLVSGQPQYQVRVDQIRMYAYYLLLRQHVKEVASSKDADKIIAAAKAETVFGGRLTNTNMLHSRALLGKAFLRRFDQDKLKGYLADTKEVEGKKVDEPKEFTQAWLKVGTPPTHEELEQLWTQGKKELGL